MTAAPRQAWQRSASVEVMPSVRAHTLGIAFKIGKNVPASVGGHGIASS